jgi:hypothetical protein
MNFRSAFTTLALSAIAVSVASAQQGDKKAPVQQAGAAAKADTGAKAATKKGSKKKKKAQAKKDSTKAEAAKKSS